MSAVINRSLVKGRYSYHSQTRRQIEEVLSQYRNLHPAFEDCLLPTGIKQELICLKGTIPISYRGNTYNIPVSIWILKNFPYSAPICWVNPTKDMFIRISQHVDKDGRVFLPYLSDWGPDVSDLMGAIQVMIMIFSELPPLFSKPKNSSNPTTSSTTTSNPPYPTNYSNISQYPQTNYYQMNAQSTSSMPNSTYPYMSYPKVSSSQTDTISVEHIRLSLETAVEDALNARLNELSSQLEAEIEVLDTTRKDLEKGSSQLESILNSFEIRLVELNQCNESLQCYNERLTESTSKIDLVSSETPDIDEFFGPTLPLYKQLVNAFVEENALVDTIFYLNEALQKGVIDLDIFIKHVRELSRRLFMNRALIKLCREKAGLPV